jgi:hypothetical protein
MIRLVSAVLAIYLGALVSASSYLQAFPALLVFPVLPVVPVESAAARTDATATPSLSSSSRGSEARARRAYAALPVAFVPNAGQFDPRVHYYARGDRFAFYLTRGGVTLAFLDRALKTVADAPLPDRDGHAVVLRFAGANPRAVPQGEERLPGDVNYFQGSNPSQWHSGLGRYARIVYREVWPGIDVWLSEQGGVLKYEFLVRAGARPEAIRLAYGGASAVAIDKDGSLRLETGMGTLHDAAPESYQTIGGVRVPVDSRYDLEPAAPPAGSAVRTVAAAAAPDAERRFGFVVGQYRRDVDLVIDPGVRYATFLGDMK